MKKTALIFIMAAMMFIFASCGSENADNANSTTTNSVTESSVVISEDKADISDTDEVIAQNEAEAAAVTTSASSEQAETPEEPASSK